MPVGAIVGATVVGAGTSVIAGNKAAKAQKNAANTAAAAQDRASDVQKYIYDTTRSDYAPWRAVGEGALYQLADMYGVPRPVGGPAIVKAPTSVADAFGVSGNGRFLPTAVTPVPQGSTPMTAGFSDFKASPGYQFRVDQALKAIQRSAAARGNLRSGATMEAIGENVQGIASNEYENYANHLAALAGIGQSATAGTANAGANYASGQTGIAGNLGQLALASGNARASSYANTGNAINQGVQNLASAYLYNQGFGGGFGGGTTIPAFGNA